MNDELVADPDAPIPYELTDQAMDGLDLVSTCMCKVVVVDQLVTCVECGTVYAEWSECVRQIERWLCQ
jgi:hypothetical protein